MWWSPKAADTALAMAISRNAEKARALDQLRVSDPSSLIFMATVSMNDYARLAKNVLL
jgi:hypothetical protein